MSDPEQRREGLLAERRDPFAQGIATPERARGEPDVAPLQRPRSGARGMANTRAGDFAFPIVGGEMGERIRAHDWSATLLGPLEQWPACLRNALETVLRSPVPMSISWGGCGLLLYNDAMAPVLGLHHPHVLGANSVEVWPAHAEWTGRVLRQVLAGESVSLHNQQLEVRRSGMREQTWFDLDYSPIVDEHGRPQGMLTVLAEITGRVAALSRYERLEKNLRESDARQRFVLAFNDRVRHIVDPQVVMNEAVAALGAQLEVTRCGYAHVGSNVQQLDIKAEWTSDREASGLGVQSIADAGAAVRRFLQSGKTFVMGDAGNDARELVREHATTYLDWGVGAVVAAPLIHNGRWVALLYVASAQARAWSGAEIALVEEMAARIWEAVERARAEAALRGSEMRFRELFESVPAAVSVCDRNAVIQDYNARAAELWGRSPIRGVDKRGSLRLWQADGNELPPDFAPAEEVMRSARALRGVEMVIGRPDGSRLPAEVDFSPLKNARGEITGAIIAFNDISDRKLREANITLLADIAEATSHCDDETQIMHAVSVRIGAHLHLHCCCLISIDEAHDSARTDQVWYAGDVPQLPRRAPLSSFVVPAFNEEARAGNPLVVCNTYADSRTDGDAYARYEVGSFISVPWHQGDAWHGLLAFCDQAPRQWREDEIELVREIASRILPRIERARAQVGLRESEQRLAAQVADLERLHALGTRLMKQDDLESVLREVMAAARELLHADRASVQSREHGKLRRVDSIGLPRELGERFHLVQDDDITTCAAAARTGERIVVEEFATDPRFTEMAAVFEPLGVCAAVSMPLLGEEGSVIAMFSLYFDHRWHPDAHALRMLDLYAQQAAVQIERVRGERDSAWLSAIVTSSHDAIISKDLGGIITTWNKGAEWLFGYSAEEAIGHPITLLMPPDKVSEEPGILARIRAGAVVDHFETIRRRKDGALLDVSLTVAPIRDPQGRIVGASKIARDITARKQAEGERVTALAREREAREEAEILVEAARLLSGELAYDDLVQKMTDLATRLTGAQYGSFFYNVTDDKGESYMLYALAGADRSQFDQMPLPRNTPLFQPTFAGERVVRCGDVTRHPDFGTQSPYHGLPEGHLPVRSYMAVPVVSRSGKVHGGLFFAHAECDVFSERDERLVQGIAAHAAIALDNSGLYQDVADSEAHLRQMIDALPTAIYTTDAAGRITHFNPAAVEFSGRTPTLGSDEWCVTWKLYRADGSPMRHDECPMALALQKDRAIFGGIEAIAERPDGEQRWFTPYPTPLHDAHGKLTGGINMLVDITDRKRDEQALIESEARFRQMIDALPTAIYTTDAQGRLTHFNPAAVEFSGRTPRLGSDEWCVTWKLYNPDGSRLPHDECPMAIALQEDRAIDGGVEAIAERPDGERRWFTPYPTPLHDIHGTLVGGINMLVDITERKRDELLLFEQKRVLEQVAAGCELSRCLQELSESVSRFDPAARGCVVLAEHALEELREANPAFLPTCFEDSSGKHICELAAGISNAAMAGGQPVDCADVAHDPRWPQAWREKCHHDGVQACHATPILNRHGQPIGSFFLALNRVGEPSSWHRRLAEFGARITSLVIERGQSERAVRESETQLAKELADTRLLQRISTELLSETNPDALYARIVEAAASIMRSDAAGVQMFHPERGQGGELHLLAHRGFNEDAASQWEWIGIHPPGTSCSLAVRQGRRVIVKDVRECAALLGPEGVAAHERAGIRATQSTPLHARSGKLVGMLSTHWREPHEPSARRLGLLDVLGRQAADLIENRRSEQKLLELNTFLERRVSERTEELIASEREVRRMASQLTMVEHAERRRISQILHDDLQQQLHSIQMKLASARGALGRGDEARTLRHLSDAEQWSGEGVETARRLTVDLSPPILRSEGLAEALDWLVTQVREMHGLHVEIAGDRDLRMPDDAKRVLIYQIVRELLFNIVKHAGTDSARIELRRHPEMLDVSVLDQGKGFDSTKLLHPEPRSAGGFGLTSARERLHLMGGSIAVDSSPGAGTCVVLHVPIRRADESIVDEPTGAEIDNTEDLFGLNKSGSE